jgi:DNA-binding ferritin-like protein
MKSQFTDLLTAQHNLAAAAHLAHWNVRGSHFYEYHLLFERIYEMVKEKMDGLAEQARGHGIEIPASIYHDVPELEWGSEMELAAELYKVCEEYCDALDKLHEKADDAGKYGLLNVLEDLMTDANTVKYLLGSVNDELGEEEKEEEEEEKTDED